MGQSCSTEFTGQQERILDLLKSRGYGNWVERYEFLDLQPRICDFTTRIFELRWKRDLNIGIEKCRVDGELHTRYRLLPGSWHELRGKPESKKDAGDSRLNRALEFERQFRPRSHPWKNAFSAKRLAQDDCFVLTPPEPRP
jgi:hypothetical protein